MSIDVSQHWAVSAGTRTNTHRSEAVERPAGHWTAPQPTAGQPTGVQPGASTHGAGAGAGTGAETFGFADFVDIINPLHHIPIVGTMYREISGDEIKPVSRVLGSGLFGGPVGLASGVMSAMIEETTGRDPAGHVYAAITGAGPVRDQGTGAPLTSPAAVQHWASAEQGVSGPASGPASAPATQSPAGMSQMADAEAAQRHWAQQNWPSGSAADMTAAGSMASSIPDGNRQPAAAQAPGTVGQRTENLASSETGATATVTETLTFFPVGRGGGGPRTVTLDRPGPPAGSPAHGSDSQHQAPGSASIMPTSAPRVDNHTDTVLRALAVAAADEPSRRGRNDDNSASQPTPAPRPAAAPQSAAPVEPERMVARQGDDIAAAMMRALDQYQTPTP